MADWVSSIVALGGLLRSIGPDVSSAFSVKDAVDNMRGAMEDLQARKRDIERTIEDGRTRGETPTEPVRHWLGKVSKIDAKVTKVANIYEQRGYRLIRDCSFNCWSTNKISREAKKLRQKVVELQQEVFAAVLTRFPRRNPRELLMRQYLTIGNSVNSRIQTVDDYLRDVSVGIVGIWGMGGVGKTTLLNLLHDSLLGERGLRVIWVPNNIETIENLQKSMISELGLEVQRDVKSDANTINNFLRDQNFVLLIDGLLKELNLVDVGIPMFHVKSNSAPQYKRKVIFTTLHEKLCKQMRSHRTLKLEPLPKEEAMLLFKNIVFEDHIHYDPRISNLVTEDIEECDGSPLALVVIGKTLIGQSTFPQWEHTVDSLKKSKYHSHSYMTDKIVPILKLSYDNLQDDRHRQCFLSCCLWPKDQYIQINDLIECWMGLGLINEFEQIYKVFNQGKSIIEDLKDACLLESDLADDQYVKLHSLVWDLALWVAWDCGESLNKWIVIENRVSQLPGWCSYAPEDGQQWVLTERLSIMNTKRESLPDQIQHSPRLSTLVLKGNLYMEHVQDSLLPHMKGLLYLNLSYTIIEQLPEGIGNLVNLQHLNLSNTRISSLPRGLAHMTRLKYLLLRNIKNLDEESFGAIVHLYILEVLDTSPYVEVPLNFIEETKQGRLELQRLQPTTSDSFESLKFISISTAVKSKNYLRAILNDFFLKGKMRRIRLYDIEDLLVIKFEELSIFQPFLQELEVYSCPALGSLEIDSGDAELFRLEKLRFWNLPNLDKIVWSGIVPSQFFPSFRILVIEECDKLRNISWVLKLPCLMKLHVARCHAMIEITDAPAGEIEVDMTDSAFPMLRELHLLNLPLLRSICNQALTFPSLQSVEVLQCPQLRQLPFHPQMVKDSILKCIAGDRKWLKGLKWENDDTKSYFHKYFQVKEDHLVHQYNLLMAAREASAS